MLGVSKQAVRVGSRDSNRQLAVVAMFVTAVPQQASSTVLTPSLITLITSHSSHKHTLHPVGVC